MIYRRVILVIAFALQGCTTVTIDEYRTQQSIDIGEGEYVVVLGRRQSSNYETEPSLVSCISETLASEHVPVIPEEEFVDSLYPWFEPRTAPMRIKDMNRLLKRKQVVKRMDDYSIRYIIWVDGNTETTDSAGSIGCSIGAGGAGCFGFGTWEKESDYEANVWDYRQMQNVGQVSADAAGTSYMPAVIVPIPIIARVQNNACKAMAAQLRSFFAPVDEFSESEP